MWGVSFSLIYLFKLLNNKFCESFWIFRGQISFVRHFRQARRNKIGILRAGRSISPQVAAFDILNKSDYPSGGAKMTLPLDGAHFRPINTSSKGRVVGLLFRKSQLIKRADRGRVIQSEANIKAEKLLWGRYKTQHFLWLGVQSFETVFLLRGSSWFPRIFLAWTSKKQEKKMVWFH